MKKFSRRCSWVDHRRVENSDSNSNFISLLKLKLCFHGYLKLQNKFKLLSILNLRREYYRVSSYSNYFEASNIRGLLPCNLRHSVALNIVNICQINGDEICTCFSLCQIEKILWIVMIFLQCALLTSVLTPYAHLQNSYFLVVFSFNTWH